MMLSPQWESRSEFYVHSGNATVHSTRKLLVHTLSSRLYAKRYWYSSTGRILSYSYDGTSTVILDQRYLLVDREIRFMQMRAFY